MVRKERLEHVFPARVDCSGCKERGVRRGRDPRRRRWWGKGGEGGRRDGDAEAVGD